MIEAVIFDLDGVLVQSEEVWERVRRRFVEDNGGTWHQQSHRHMMGVSTAAWVDYLVSDLGVRLPPDEVAKRVIGELLEDYSRQLPLLPGAVEAVRGLATELRLAVASGSPISLIDAVLRGANIRGLFEVVVSSDEVAAGKPAPDVYFEACSRLGVEPSRCVVVEDSTNGIRSAAAAGTRIIAIPNRRYPPESEALRLAHAVLPDIRALTPEVMTRLGTV
jgi:HAD superfamily hydrolase (TIGR01509 family)